MRFLALFIIEQAPLALIRQRSCIIEQAPLALIAKHAPLALIAHEYQTAVVR